MTRTWGFAYGLSKPLDKQVDWPAHAAFMDGLVAEGFVLLGGPLEGTSDVLLIVRADSPEQVRSRLDADCWTERGLLRTVSVVPWTLRLGSVG